MDKIIIYRDKLQNPEILWSTQPSRIPKISNKEKHEQLKKQYQKQPSTYLIESYKISHKGPIGSNYIDHTYLLNKDDKIDVKEENEIDNILSTFQTSMVDEDVDENLEEDLDIDLLLNTFRKQNGAPPEKKRKLGPWQSAIMQTDAECNNREEEYIDLMEDQRKRINSFSNNKQ